MRDKRVGETRVTGGAGEEVVSSELESEKKAETGEQPRFLLLQSLNVELHVALHAQARRCLRQKRYWILRARGAPERTTSRCWLGR